jgi:NTP pyrophosphatase (non-canonical NTP hydrolase)
MDIYDEIRAERDRAHAKHAETSMEAQPIDALLRLAILMEEVGEVAKEFNEARHRAARGGPDLDITALRKELIQTAAMATAWADACGAELETVGAR